MNDASWDAFIAYSSPERATADELYAALTSGGARVFLDHECLEPGDIWPAIFPVALRAARIVVVLVSRHSERALYQLEEVAEAIPLSRKDPERHRVVPVFLDDDVDPPYGLRIHQGLSLDTEGGAGGVAVRLLGLLGLASDGADAAGIGAMPAPLPVKPRPPRGSPFRPGTPLYVGDLLPGDSRQALVAAICDAIARADNVNLVGERRLGRTTTLNHAWGELVADDHLVVRVDMQGVADAERFYGRVLAAVARSPLGVRLTLLDASELTRVGKHGASYEDLVEALVKLRSHMRLVVLVDEFEVCFELPESFVFPTFYNHLRSLLGGDQHAPLMHIVVATREPLAEYFRRGQMTSSLPSYLPITRMQLLTSGDVEQVLAQAASHALSPMQRDHASAFAAGHPCLVQCGGDAWHRANELGHERDWAEAQMRERAAQACMGVEPTAQNGAQQAAGARPPSRSPRWGRRR